MRSMAIQLSESCITPIKRVESRFRDALMKRSAQPLSQALHPVIVTFLSFVTLTTILGLFAPLAHSVEVILAWDASIEPDLAGYKLYYKTDTSGPPYNGTGATEGESPIDVGNLTEFTVHGLTEVLRTFLLLLPTILKDLKVVTRMKLYMGKRATLSPLRARKEVASSPLQVANR